MGQMEQENKEFGADGTRKHSVLAEQTYFCRSAIHVARGSSDATAAKRGPSPNQRGWTNYRPVNIVEHVNTNAEISERNQRSRSTGRVS
jgi:hypothetical protein